MQKIEATPAKPVISMCFSLMLALGKTTGGNMPEAADYRLGAMVGRLHTPEQPSPTIH